MKYLAYIIGVIDAMLKGHLGDNSQGMGLAQLVRRVGNDKKEQIWPASYVVDGECVYAGIDDQYDSITYHRSIAMAFSRGKTGRFGDNAGDVQLVHRMSLVVWADKRKIGYNADELALVLQQAFPDQLTGDARPANFKVVNININDIVLNESQVFGEEYKNVDYFLGPEHVLIKLNYSIESTLSKSCFKKQCP